MFTVAEVNKNLKSMLKDLKAVKAAAVYMMNKLSNDMPEAFMGAGDGDMSPEDKQGLAPAFEGGEAGEAGGEGAEEGEAGEKKEHEIKTPEEAKKTVNEAITDLKSVVDGIDNITEGGQEMEEKTSSQTFRLSAKVQSEIGVLTQQAVAALEDGQSAIKHWAFLLRKKPLLSASAHPLVEAAKQAVNAYKELGQVLGTAVAPTGAEFSGDKPAPKRPEKVEVDHWHAGNEKFHSNKAKEDKMPNSASEPRLKDEGNPHELGAYVNAKAVAKNDKFSSALVIRSLNANKQGKVAVVTWDGLSDDLGKKNAVNYAKFLAPAFAQNVEAHVKKAGIDSVASYLNAQIVTIGGLKSTAREPKIEDKAEVRKYYADAFGDAEYARELTSAQKQGAELGLGINSDKAGNVAKGGDEMNVAYKPEAESADAEKGGLEGGNKADSLGNGAVPTKGASLEDRKAKARKAVDFARLAASRGLIPFTKTAVADKAREVVAFSAEKFAAQLELISSMPEVVAEATKEGHIPDADSGIVGNTREAVRDQNGKAETEGLNNDVKSDAKVSQAAISAAKTRTANVVPQMQLTSSLTKESFTNKMNTLQSRLAAKGLTLEGSIRRVGPTYKKH